MPAPRKYPQELRDRAIRLVLELREQNKTPVGSVARVASQLGINAETLCGWVAQAEIDNGQHPGTTTDERQRIAALEREVRELRRANEIPKAASAFFAAELDHPRTR